MKGTPNQKVVLLLVVAFAVWVSQLAIGGSLVHAAPNGFQALDLGYPVARFEQVDVNGDGVWELRILTGENPARCGVYSPAKRTWLDGPLCCSNRRFVK